MSRALAACLAVGCLLLVVARNWQPLVTSQFVRGSDPWDFLGLGEILGTSSSAFIVEAHCSNAKYQPEGWIELRHGGDRVDVEVRRLEFAGATYFQIVSIGGVASP